MTGSSGRDHNKGREYAREQDADDPLAGYRDRFTLPDPLYFDGNSLGPVSDAAATHLDRAVDAWRDRGIRGWTEADPPWFWYGEELGADLAPLLGASGEECVVTGTTTVNIHNLLGTFLDADPDRPPGVVVNELDFPSDHYAVRAQLRNRGYDPDAHMHVAASRDGRTIRTEDVITAMDAQDVGIVFMSSVLYRSGQLLDIDAITAAAHDRDIVAGFDLAHSIGIIPHTFSEIGVDFAVWCSYKYLNAGPGAVGGLYVNERHFGTSPALAGWWGHAKDTQFEMRPTFTPARGAGAWQISTIPVLSAAPLRGSVDLVREAGIEAIREKSLDLTASLITQADDRLTPHGCTVGTPRSDHERGGHIAIEHPDAARIARTLRDHGAIVDYRPPNVIRVCPAPLYTRYEDVWEFTRLLEDLLRTNTHQEYDAGNVDVT